MENSYIIIKLHDKELEKIKDLWIDNWGSDYIRPTSQHQNFNAG